MLCGSVSSYPPPPPRPRCCCIPAATMAGSPQQTMTITDLMVISSYKYWDFYNIASFVYNELWYHYISPCKNTLLFLLCVKKLLTSFDPPNFVTPIIFTKWIIWWKSPYRHRHRPSPSQNSANIANNRHRPKFGYRGIPIYNISIQYYLPSQKYG